MTVTLSTRSLMKLGAVAAAVSAIAGMVVGAWAFAKPVILHPPPWEELEKADKLEVKVAASIQTDAQTQQYLKTMQQQVLFLAQQNWTLVQSNAEAQLRQNPNNLAARQQLNTAKQALYGIQRQLYGGK